MSNKYAISENFKKLISVAFSVHNQQQQAVRVATQYASPCKLTISSYLLARWHLFRHVD